MVGVRSLLIGLAFALASAEARAADVSGAQLVVTREQGAEDCPDEEVVASDVQRRLERTGSRDRAPTVIDVRLSREGDDYGATIRVRGQSTGVRVLRVAGPTCQPLYGALIVAILIVFDASAIDETPVSPRDDKAVSALARAPPADATGPADRSGGLHLWTSAAVALTHGLPLGFGVAAFAGLDARVERWDFGVGGYWAPDRSAPLPPGSVLVRSWGGRVRGCYGLMPASATARLAACAWGVLSALHGAGRGFDSTTTQDRAWATAGPGVDFALRVSPALAFGAQAVMLVSVHREAFYVQGLGTPFETDPVVGWIGADVRLRIW